MKIIADRTCNASSAYGNNNIFQGTNLMFSLIFVA